MLEDRARRLFQLKQKRLSFRIISLLFVFSSLIVMYGRIENVHGAEKVVNIYCSLDQVYSEPILREFERKTGIKVKAKFDVEAVKTVGLVNAVVAEKNNPRCDVLWNNEVMHTVILKKMGLLAPYISPSAKDIPDIFKDKNGYWTGLAARGRVIIYNKTKVHPDEIPRTINDFLNPRWKGMGAIALPLFGTTATHGAALFAAWGEAEGKAFFQRLKANGIVIAPGNARVKDLVASGELTFGLTDTDDAHIAILAGSPVGMVFPDQDGMGSLILPNSVAMIKGCPHPEEARMLIDYILSKEVEEKLALGRSAQIPLHRGARKPPGLPGLNDIKTMKVDYEKLSAEYPRSSEALKEIFLR
jgi:iron(III) transport system substrate-binding protein